MPSGAGERAKPVLRRPPIRCVGGRGRRRGAGACAGTRPGRHQESIEAARANAEAAGVSERVGFELADAASYAGSGYDLICFFDCLHHLGYPVGPARRAYDALAEDGTVMLVEPFAGDSVPDSLGPVGRLYYSASTGFCVPHSRSETVALALGAQAGPARLADVFREAGFRSVRRAYESPLNIVLEIRR